MSNYSDNHANVSEAIKTIEIKCNLNSQSEYIKILFRHFVVAFCIFEQTYLSAIFRAYFDNKTLAQ